MNKKINLSKMPYLSIQYHANKNQIIRFFYSSNCRISFQYKIRQLFNPAVSNDGLKLMTLFCFYFIEKRNKIENEFKPCGKQRRSTGTKPIINLHLIIPFDFCNVSPRQSNDCALGRVIYSAYQPENDVKNALKQVDCKVIYGAYFHY